MITSAKLRAGFPETVAPLGTSCDTTEPGPSGRPFSKIRHHDGARADPAVRSHGNPPKRSPFIGEAPRLVTAMLPRSAQNLHVTGQERSFADIYLSQYAVGANPDPVTKRRRWSARNTI